MSAVRFCFFGPKGGGKTRLISRLVASWRSRRVAVLRIRSKRAERGKGAGERGLSEIHQYLASGAVSAGEIVCSEDKSHQVEELVTEFDDRAAETCGALDAVFLEAESTPVAADRSILVTQPLTFDVEPDEVPRLYADLGYADMVVVDLEPGADREESLVGLRVVLGAIRFRDLVFRGLDFSERYPIFRAGAISDRQDPEVKKALALVKRWGARRATAHSISTRVYEIEVALEEVRPRIWRRFLVPANFTFFDLHWAIQNAMGWNDDHLHEFEVRTRNGRPSRIGIPIEETSELLPGWKEPLHEWLRPGEAVVYRYDFGDEWMHTVLPVRLTQARPGQRYPVMLGGERACPPEDCGGAPGYEELLAALADPFHERHEELRAWIGGSFDPDSFDPASVRFTDSRRELEDVLEHLPPALH